MTRQSRRLAAWTVGWTVFQWWAVIGWPETLEGALAALLTVSAASSVALVGWYGVRCRWPRTGPEGRESVLAGDETGP